MSQISIGSIVKHKTLDWLGETLFKVIKIEFDKNKNKNCYSVMAYGKKQKDVKVYQFYEGDIEMVDRNF